MKLILDLSAAVLALFVLSGCVASLEEYNVAYDVTCTSSSDDEMPNKLRSIAQGVADRVHMPRPGLTDRPNLHMLLYITGWNHTRPNGADENWGTIYFSYSALPGNNRISIVIHKRPREDDAYTKNVRTAIDAELGRSGCSER